VNDRFVRDKSQVENEMTKTCRCPYVQESLCHYMQATRSICVHACVCARVCARVCACVFHHVCKHVCMRACLHMPISL